MPNFTEENLIRNSYDRIAWQDVSYTAVTEKKEFIGRHFELIKDRILEITKNDCKYQIMQDRYINLDLASDFEIYYDNCGALKYQQYPLFDIIISYYKDGNFMYQNHFDFLKTDNGFKLIGLTIRDGRLN